jgi:hypothetical protein
VPALRRIDGIDYYNCGDWIEHCSAIVEHLDGRIELVYADDFPGTSDTADAWCDPGLTEEAGLAASWSGHPR